MIRTYRESDWSQICTVCALSKPDEMKDVVDAQLITPLAQDEQMRRYFAESEVWVHEEEGNVLGFIGRKNDVVSWLFVHPDHRRKGIARSLLMELIKSHSGPLRLNLVKANHPARTLYESLGFEVFEEFEGSMFGSPIPAVRMRLA